jgi:hypothetical protein
LAAFLHEQLVTGEPADEEVVAAADAAWAREVHYARRAAKKRRK